MKTHIQTDYHVRTTSGRTAMAFDTFESAARFQSNNPGWLIVKVIVTEEDVTPLELTCEMLAG